MGSKQELEQLREAMRFEEEQLELIRARGGNQDMTPVQQENWPAMIASHERAIALYRARIAGLERG